MTIDLITGHADTKHVSALDAANFHIGILGSGIYQLADKDGNFAKPSVKNANTITVPASNWLIHGRHVRVDSAEDITIESGQSGYKRIDLIVFHYVQDAQGVEKVTLEVVKGSRTIGTASVPSISSSRWDIESTSDSRIELARVTLNGLTPSAYSFVSPLPNLTGVDTDLSKVSTRVDSSESRLNTVESSLSMAQSDIRNLESRLTAVRTTTMHFPYISKSEAVIHFTRIGNMVTVTGTVTADGTNTSSNVETAERIPAGYRPINSDGATIIMHGHTGKTWFFTASSDGVMTKWGDVEKDRVYAISGTWRTADA